jgi:hypothetical protein
MQSQHTHVLFSAKKAVRILLDFVAETLWETLGAYRISRPTFQSIPDATLEL